MSQTTASPRPITQRPLDLGLAVVFSVFAVTSLVFDMMTALDIPLQGSTNPLAQATLSYATTVDPLLLQNPLFLRLMCVVSAFVMGPFYLVLVYALVKSRPWIRLPSIVYASAILYSMVIYLGVELLGDTPPLNLPAFLGATLPYVIAPLVLLVRMWPERPFDAPNPPD